LKIKKEVRTFAVPKNCVVLASLKGKNK